MCNPANFVTHLLMGVVCFHLGFTAGGGLSGFTATAAKQPICDCSEEIKAAAGSARRDTEFDAKQSQSEARHQEELPVEDPISKLPPLFPGSMNQLFQGSTRVARKDFVQHLNLGIPVDNEVTGNEEVLVLYTDLNAVPDDSLQLSAKSPSLLPFHTAQNAFAQCQTVKVIYQQQSQKREKSTCLAFMGQYESYHIHKYMRIPEDVVARKGVTSVVDTKLPLRYVSRSQQANGRKTNLPLKRVTENYWAVLMDYLTKYPKTSERLKPIAQRAAAKNGAIVVMVCNHGQSELLFNFICSAKSRGLDISSILLFATDAQTVELALELGIHVFDVQDDFGEMPTEAARLYGDKYFTGMMMAKVYCVHLINNLGYDLLFQDVDITWRRDPLDFFNDPKQSGDFDIYFQDDGARSVRYTPYSPNSGFYFVRYNERTHNFFNVFIRMGDLIQASGSHQSALNAILSEQVSYRGLRVKVYGKDDKVNLFPGGFHYHKRHDYMKDMMQNKVSPYIFHMSWTKNKDNKRLFFQQMGDWFVKPECENRKISDIDKKGKPFTDYCCSVDALVSCHYRDKPSIVPCREKPPIDKGKKSFW